MSPRAAWRLDSIGFKKVFDYVPGKADWFASGLPKEGKLASIHTIADAARRDVPTCALEETVGTVRERVRKAGWDACVVVNKERVVLGLLQEKELASDPEALVEQMMTLGPTTFRPDVPAGTMAKRMHERGAPTVVVTTSDGKLVGLLYRNDAERVAGE